MSRIKIPLEAQCRALGLPVPVRELHFHPTRRWRVDYAFVDAKLAVEIEGGVFAGGRHTRGDGFRRDVEKYAEALILGWRVLRVLPEDVSSGRAVNWIQRALESR